MEKKSIIKLILDLSREKKEYLYNNLEELRKVIASKESVKKFAQVGGFLDLLSTFDTGQLESEILAYTYNPSHYKASGGMDRLYEAVDDIFMEVSDDPNYEDQRGDIINYAENILSSDENLDRFISEYQAKFMGSMESPAQKETPDNPIDDMEPETGGLDLSEEIITKPDGTFYRTTDGIFPIPVDKDGNPLLQNLELFSFAQELMDEAAQEGITPETSKQNFEEEMEEYIVNNLDYGSLRASSDKIVSSMTTFQKKMEQAFPLLTIQNIEYAILGRMGAESFSELKEKYSEQEIQELYAAAIKKISECETPNDKTLFSAIQSLRFYDDLLRDFAGYQRKRVLSNSVNNDQYESIMKFAEQVYGSGFFDTFEGAPYEIHQVAQDIKTRRGSYSPKTIHTYEVALKTFEGDNAAFESVLQDLFSRNSLKYYKAAQDVSKYYSIEQELLRAKGNNPNLSQFCARCGRFRQNDYNRRMLEKDFANYYIVDPDGKRRYNIEAFPDPPIETQQLALISEEARELINTPCDKQGCNPDEYFVENYFAAADQKFSNYSFYYGYKPLMLDGEEVEAPVLTETPSDTKPMVLADKWYQDHINSTLERLVKSGLDKEEIKRSMMNWIQYASAIIPPKDKDGNKIKGIGYLRNNPEYFEEESEEGAIGLGAFDALTDIMKENLSEESLARLEKLKEINPNIDESNIRELLAQKEVWRLTPHDYPSGNLVTEMLGHQNIFVPGMDWPGSGVSPYYGLSNDLNQFVHVTSTTKFLKVQEKINSLALRLAEEMIASRGQDDILTGDRNQLIEEARRILGMKNLTVPIAINPVKPTKTKPQLEELAAVREKLLEISFANDVESLPPSYREGVDYLVYDINPEEVIDKAKQIMDQYATRLRSVLAVDFDATLESNKKKRELIKFIHANPFAKKVLSYTNIFLFRNALEQAIKKPMSAEEVNEAYLDRYGVEYETLFPLEDQALLNVVDETSKQRSDIDPMIIKLSLRDEIAKIHMDFATTKGEPAWERSEEGTLIPQTTGKSDDIFQTLAATINPSVTEANAEGSSTASFLKYLLTDPVVSNHSRFSQYQTTKTPDDPVNYYSPTKGVPGVDRSRISYTDALDVFAKFLNSDDDIGIAILDDVFGKKTMLEPQVRQLMSAFSLSRMTQKTRGKYASTREALYMASNMTLFGSVPERHETFNFVGWTDTKSKSLISASFGRRAAKWMQDIDLGEFLGVPGGFRTRITKKSDRDSWYKKAQKKENPKEDKLKEDKPRYVFVYSNGDAQHLIDSTFLGGRKAVPKRIMMPKMAMIPFERFGSVFAAVQTFAGTDLNPIIVTDSDLELLRKIQ